MSSSNATANEPAQLKTTAAAILGAANSMAFTAGMTVETFIDANDLYGEIMRRRCQEVRLPPDVQSALSTYPDLLYLIVLATPEDPDTVAVVPVLHALVQCAPRLALRVIRDEDDLTLLNGLLETVDLLNDLEDVDLPQAFIFDEEWQLVEQWGPRPQEAEAYLDAWLERNPDYEALADAVEDADLEAYGKLLEQLTYEMRLWYNSGLDKACIDEIYQLLMNLQSDD